jgi:hypothetical protein
MPEGEDKGFITNADLQLELRALRSDVKLWVLGAVALNQFLAGVDLPSSITGAAILAFAAKGVVVALFRG